ncbi:MAG: hydroxymethylbilane synthase [Myxococcota bacterium]
MKVRIATRKSQLALTQTRWVAAQLKKLRPALNVEEVHVVTQGDKILDRPLSTIGGKGLFVSEVEACLLDDRADIAVHSIKDVPSRLADGLCMGAIPVREDPRDVLCSKDGTELDGLEAGAKIGTSSLRRSAQLRAARPDLAFQSLRGNVPTRLRKLDEGQYDAIVLAAAGLRRLELLERPHWVISPELCIPAVGQGALGIEARMDDDATLELLAGLDDPQTRLEVDAERALLKDLEGSCKVPIAGHARLGDGNRLTLHAMVGSLDGTTILSGASDAYLEGRGKARGEAARALGTEVAAGLIKRGAKDLIREAIAAVERQQKQGNGSGSGNYGKWS